jgi:hypothetical protein
VSSHSRVGKRFNKLNSVSLKSLDSLAQDEFAIASYHESPKQQYQKVQNIEYFAAASRDYGVPSLRSIRPSDILSTEFVDEPRVVHCLYLIAQIANENNITPAFVMRENGSLMAVVDACDDDLARFTEEINDTPTHQASLLIKQVSDHSDEHAPNTKIQQRSQRATAPRQPSVRHTVEPVTTYGTPEDVVKAVVRMQVSSRACVVCERATEV